MIDDPDIGMSWEETKTVMHPHKHAAGLQWKRCVKCGRIDLVPLSQVKCRGLLQICGGVLVRKVWTESLAPRRGNEIEPMNLPGGD